MTEKEMQEVLQAIKSASEEGAKNAIKELRKRKMYKPEMDAYEKTEYILRNYHEFKRAIMERQEAIQDIDTHGIKKKSCSVTSYPGGTRYISDDAEKAEEQIALLEHQNEITMRLIQKVENALNELKLDPYYAVLHKYYFEKKKYEIIAGELGIGISSVSQARRQLTEKVKIRLFPDESLQEIFGGV